MLLVNARAWILELGGGGGAGVRRELTLIGHLLYARCCVKSYHMLSHSFLNVSAWCRHFHSCFADGKTEVGRH